MNIVQGRTMMPKQTFQLETLKNGSFQMIFILRLLMMLEVLNHSTVTFIGITQSLGIEI